MLPIAAPATAPAVSFGIGGISMFSAAGGPPLCCVSGLSAINNKLLRSYVQSRIAWHSHYGRAIVQNPSTGKRLKKSSVFEKACALLAAAPLTTISATAPITTAASVATAPGRTLFARSGLVDRQRPAFYSLAVDLGDRVLRVLIGAHCHKGEAARFPGKFVLHQHDFLDSASLGEEFLKFVLGRVEWEISHV
jgi:hypothetical protein